MEPHIQLTLLRHGRSLADDEGKFEGRYDSPLTATGQAQAMARAQGWQQDGVRFDRVIASTMQRAHSTARIVAEHLGVPLELDPAWMEIDNGMLAGLTYAEADLRFPRPPFRSPFEPIGISGESEVQIHARAALALENVIRRGAGSTLVVAHGGILNAALRVVCGSPLPVNFSGVWFRWSDLGFCRLTYDMGRHVWTIKELRG